MKRDERLVPLSNEHHQALVLCLRIDREVETATATSLDQLYHDAIRFWRDGLIPHFGAEGDCLLARLVRHVAPGHPDMMRLQSDHLRVAGIMADMRDAASEGAKRDALRDLAHTLRAHVRWEESAFFPLVEEHLSGVEMDRVAQELLERLPDEPSTAYGTGIPPRSASQ